MQARSAYISSLSTTSIMVASAVLMLGLLGAVVGFRSWPHADGGAGVDQIGVSPPAVGLAATARIFPAPPRTSPRAAAPAPSTAGLRLVPASAVAAAAPATVTVTTPPAPTLPKVEMTPPSTTSGPSSTPSTPPRSPKRTPATAPPPPAPPPPVAPNAIKQVIGGVGTAVPGNPSSVPSLPLPALPVGKLVLSAD